MGKEFSRARRVNKLLREEISRLLQREVKDARIGTVTVVDVEAARDLKVAKVYVQVPGDEARREAALAGLSSAAGFIRSRLGRELRIRRAPELHFELDLTYERAARISELLADLEQEPEGGSDEE